MIPLKNISQKSSEPVFDYGSRLSIVLPAKNEQRGLDKILPRIQNIYPTAEIIVVNDGSTDNTSNICKNHKVEMFSHPYSIGNGAAIKNGARNARGDVIVFMDADGQHNPDDIPRLLEQIRCGYDMAIGARTSTSHANTWRRLANGFYNHLASWITGQQIKDLTSGFRAVRSDKFQEFIHLLPNGFSYPTTITMAFFRSAYSVVYVPITTNKRIGKSHLNIIKDGVNFLIIIFKIGTLYSPLKIFFPTSFSFFSLGISYYLYTFFSSGRFTNMGILLFITSCVIFMIGLISEQITGLLYSSHNLKRSHIENQ